MVEQEALGVPVCPRTPPGACRGSGAGLVIVEVELRGAQTFLPFHLTLRVLPHNHLSAHRVLYPRPEDTPGGGGLSLAGEGWVREARATTPLDTDVGRSHLVEFDVKQDLRLLSSCAEYIFLFYVYFLLGNCEMS